MRPETAELNSPDLRLFACMPGNTALLLPDAPKFTIVAATEGYYRALGRTPEALAGKGVFEAFPAGPEQPDLSGEKRARASLAQAIASKETFYLPYNRYDVAGPDGRFEEKYWSITNKPFLGKQGEVLYILHTIEDVTGKVQSLQREQQIRDIEKSYNLFMQAPVIIGIVKGEDYVIELANENLLEVWGRTAEVIGKPLTEAIPELKDQGFTELLDQVRLTGNPYYAFERPITLVRGGQEQVLYFNFVYKPYYEGGNKTAAGVFSVGLDVTEQVMAKLKSEAANKELQFVTDTVPQLVWSTEPDGYSSFFNKGWLQYTGLAFEDLKGDGWVNTLHPDDRERTFNAWRAAVATGGSYDVEYRLRRYDGSYRWFVARGVAMKDADGNILKWYGTSTDIHEQKLATDALRKSDERFALVAKATQDAIWDWNLITNEIWWNEGFKTLFGYSDEDIEPGIESWYNRVHPDDKERTVGGIHRVIDAGGRQWSDEYRFRKKDGSYAIVYDRGYALHDEHGTPYRMLGSMQDVTERRKFEEQLTEREERFRTLANSIAQLAWIADAAGEIYWYNQRFYDYAGIAPGQTGQQSWEDLLHPDYAAMTAETIQRGWANREPWELTIPLRGGDGHYRWFLSRVFPLKDNEGNVVQWIGTGTDITEQKEAAAILEEKVKERTRELELRNQELEQFSYVSHHDLQEPLRKILIFTDMVKTEAAERLSPAGQKRLDKVIDAAQRMSSALRDVLNLAHLSREEQFEVVNLNDILRAVLADLELLIQEKGARISSDKLPVISAIPQQMHQLFYNLVNNALKFSRPDVPPEIAVRCHIPGLDELRDQPELDIRKPYYRISVSDNGIGFNSDAAGKIFVMFQRLHSKESYAGTGIGLALCRKVVQNHGGKIWAESSEDNGATFHVLLPGDPHM